MLNLFKKAFYVVNDDAKHSTDDYQPIVSVLTRKLFGKVEIAVCDNGQGIPSHFVDKIFQPFFTTKPTAQGTGSGLSLAYDIVKAHSRELTFEVNLPEFNGQMNTKFVLLLPAETATS